MSVPVPRLNDITQQEDSRHNARMGQQPQQQQQQHAAKDEAAAAAMQRGYFQQQYASIASAVSQHQAYLQQQQHQHQPHEHEATPTRQRSERKSGPGRRASLNQPTSQSTRGRGHHQHPQHHDDQDGYPCPCPDCNMRRYESMVGSSQHQHQQPQYHYGHNEQQQQQQQQHPMSMLPPHMSHQPMNDFEVEMYHRQMQQEHEMQQQQQQQRSPNQQGRRSPRQHSPYAFQAVGYSPDNGYYNLSPSLPQSPLQPSALPDSFSEVPYVPPRFDCSRYATMPEDNTSSDDQQTSPAKAYGHQRGAAAQSTPARQTKTARKKSTLGEEVTPTQRRQAPKPQDTSNDSAAAEQSPSNERRQQRSAPAAPQPASKSGGRKAADANRPRPVCPYSLQVRTSKWHVRSVLSPVEYPVGALIVIEGDRGKDAGVVEACGPVTGTVTDAQGTPLPMALARATPEEEKERESLEADGAVAAEAAATVASKLGLRLRIVGATFQQDRAKLTIMYEASERVDFRQMLRDMYNEFRCRIWLETPPGVPPPAGAAKARRTSPRQQPGEPKKE